MTTGSRQLNPSGGPPDREAQTGSADDAVTPRPEDRLPEPRAQKLASSDIHALPPEDVESLPDDLPPDGAANGVDDDPFASFEDELESESTRLDSQHLIAEQTTNILEESPLPPFLRVEAGKDSGREFVLNPGETAIGRSIDNDVILTDIAVSRRHVKISYEAGVLILRDLGSGNGTHVNGTRVRDVELGDGSRIEIGETVLVVHIPSEIRSSGPDESNNTDESAMPSTLRPSALGSGAALPLTPVEGLQPADMRAIATDHIAAPLVPEGRGVFIPRGWFFSLLSVVGLLILLLGATVMALFLRPSDPQVGPTHISGDRSFESAVTAYNLRNWPLAERLFRALLAEKPDDERVAQYLQLTRENQEHERRIAEARAALARGDARTALNIAANVPARSPMRRDAAMLQRAAEERLVEQMVAEGRAALARGDRSVAQERLAEARSLLPGHAGLREFAQAIRDARGAQEEPRSRENEEVAARATNERPSEERPSTERPPDERNQKSTTGSRPTPRPRPVDLGAQGREQALAAYRNGDMAGATRLARAAANAASGAERQQLEQFSDQIDQFARLYAEVRRPGAELSSLQRALQLDRQISNGHYARTLREPLVAGYIGQARDLWGRNRHSEACARVRQALELDRSHADARRMMNECEQHAARTLSEATSVEARDAERARRLYREVLLVVPSSSATYQEAYRRMNALSRRAPVDEDE